jgi:hypothetical protein
MIAGAIIKARTLGNASMNERRHGTMVTNSYGTKPMKKAAIVRTALLTAP